MSLLFCFLKKFLLPLEIIVHSTYLEFELKFRAVGSGIQQYGQISLWHLSFWAIFLLYWAKVFGQMSMGKFRLRNGSSIFEKLVDDLKRVQNKLNRVARHRRQQRSRSKSPDQSKKHSSRNLPSKSTRSREEGSSGHKESSSRGRRSDKKKRCISRRSRSKSPSTRFGHFSFGPF